MKLFKQLCEKYSEKVYSWSIKGKEVTPQNVPETTKVITFPDGATITVIHGNNEMFDYRWYTRDAHNVNFECFEDWTTPMNEVFMLFVKDFNNIEKTVEEKVTIYTHKVLRCKFSASYNRYGDLELASNIESLTSKQLNKIYEVLMLYKHNDRMVEFNKLNNLRKAKNEARKINKYLRTLKCK